MKNRHFTHLIVLAIGLISLPLSAQQTGFYDDFEDGNLEILWNSSPHLLWKADHPHTFGLTESGGNLNIAYLRNDQSAQWDNFNFTPPEPIDVSGNPQITLKIRSDVATTFTVKPIYANGKDGWMPQSIPGDDNWHSYTFALSSSNYNGSTLTKIYLYLDGGTTDPKSGTVRFDDFQIAGFTLSVDMLEATLVDSVTIDLNWYMEDTAHTDFFTIYRSTEPGFVPGPENQLTVTTDTFYRDTDLTKNTTYHYKVTATDVEGREHTPSAVSIRTSVPGTVPTPVVVGQNATTLDRYEKFELVVSMPDATYTNPYDPDEIDLRGWFFSPGGDSVRMFGFYDNYQDADQWKVRFAASEPGKWDYVLYATDMDGTGMSERGSFLVLNSDNPGWVQISEANPNYLIHDNGTSFYGLAAYYPWNVTEGRLDELAAAEANIFGYWDCTFDNAGNGGGAYLLESMQSGLGYYDQRKAARIDQVLEWAEARDLKVMYAMWTHPYLRIDNVPWADGRWNANNPYSSIVEPEDFFTDPLALEYQEKHHRYIIARWGYSTSLAIWEIINELHGTTGWVRKQEASKQWVAGVHAFFKENDPFKRPTTASFGGGEGHTHYFVGDNLGDMPNVHFYELHGWPNPHPENVVRSGLSNVVGEVKRLKSKGDRPAFFGEAGYDHMLAGIETEEYTWEYHNAFWAGLANGMASTPFWWEFNSREIFTALRLSEFSNLKNFISDIDFAGEYFAPAMVSAKETDAYVLSSPVSSFGWMRSWEGDPLTGMEININGSDLENGNYQLKWYDTWTGAWLQDADVLSVGGSTWATVPEDFEGEDLALRLEKASAGSSATQVQLFLVKEDTLIPGALPWHPKADSTLFRIACVVTDDQGLMDASFNGPVEIMIEYDADGSSETMGMTLEDGGLLIDYIRRGSSGATVTATIDGLGSDVLIIEGIVGREEANMEVHDQPFRLSTYPNPFRDIMHIRFELQKQEDVFLGVYSAQGNLLETLTKGTLASGSHLLEWNSEGYPAGIYLVKLQTPEMSGIQRCLLIH